MSFILEAIRERPEGLWLMDDASPLQDYSGFGRSGTMTGTLVRHSSLINGATYSAVLSSGVTASFPTPVFQQGAEALPFSLEAWVRTARTETGPVQILSHTDKYDGLVIDGTKVSFTTKYLTTGEARAEYNLGTARKVHVVGIHTRAKNSLFIDGELVAEVNISEAQQNDTYVATTATLYAGTTTSTQAIAVAGLATYAHALPPTAIIRHYLAGNNLAVLDDVVEAYRGIRIPLDKTTADVFLDQWWQTETEWRFGTLNNVSVYDNQLVPEVVDDLTVAGTWLDIFDLSSSDDTSIFGVVARWEGLGLTVEASVNGTTWTPVVNGKRLSLIPDGYNPTNKILQVRVSFSAGQVPGTAFLSRLNVTGFASNTLRSVSTRTPTMTNASPVQPFNTLDLPESAGVFVDSGGVLTIPADTNPSPTHPQTIELWVKRFGANPTVNVTGTTYSNGQAATATLVEGAWTLLHIVSATPITGPITVTGSAYIGHVALYPTALSATEVENINKSYVRANVVRVDDSTLINITQSLDAAEIYAYDWSINSAG